MHSINEIPYTREHILTGVNEPRKISRNLKYLVHPRHLEQFAVYSIYTVHTYAYTKVHETIVKACNDINYVALSTVIS